MKIAPADNLQLSALKAELDAKGVPRSYYSLGKNHDERTCLLFDSEKWQIFFSERGQATDLKEFLNFEDARDELIKRLS